jgi:hypothetical protein
MVSAYKDSVDQFIGYFRDQINSIASVTVPMYRKILYATALDPLARAAFGNIGHRQRFVRLINTLTSWKARNRVSLPQLNLGLRDAKRSRYRLYREVSRRLNHWPPADIIRVDASPTEAELLPFASTDEEKVITSCSYPELLYTYRNNLIHEFREPGYGIEMSSDTDNAYYASMIDGPWELVFPVGFFATTCEQAVSNLHTYLLNHQINPYTRFQFGSLWRAK